MIFRNNGFGVQSGTQSCTKGLWMWDEIFQCENENGEKLNLIIIDSEVTNLFLYFISQNKSLKSSE